MILCTFYAVPDNLKEPALSIFQSYGTDVQGGVVDWTTPKTLKSCTLVYVSA
jgi:hypothetical protein